MSMFTSLPEGNHYEPLQTTIKHNESLITNHYVIYSSLITEHSSLITHHSSLYYSLLQPCPMAATTATRLRRLRYAREAGRSEG